MTSAAQWGGASRSVTTTAARAQSSAKASAVITRATRRPSASRAMQPDGSQREALGQNPCRSAGARRRRRRAIPWRRRRRVPMRWIGKAAVGAAHRDRLAVGRDQDVRQRRADRPRGTRDHDQRRAAPAQRRSSAGRAATRPAGAEQQRTPTPNAGMRPTAPGRLATQQRDRDHPVDAVAHQPPEHAVEAERDREQRRAGPWASPRPRRSAWRADWRSRHRARADGNGRRRRAWSQARRPATPA